MSVWDVMPLHPLAGNQERLPALAAVTAFPFLLLPETDLPFQKEKWNETNNQCSGKSLPPKQFVTLECGPV